MSQSFTDKYGQRSAPLSEHEPEEVIDGPGCFGVLRGSRDRSASLELRKKSGEVLVIGYSWIESILFDPSEGVTIKAGSRTIRLKGRHLAADIRPNLRLISALALQKVAWLQELAASDLLAGDRTNPIVESIEW